MGDDNFVTSFILNVPKLVDVDGPPIRKAFAGGRQLAHMHVGQRQSPKRDGEGRDLEWALTSAPVSDQT